MVTEVYAEKRRESGPELWEVGAGVEKPAKKTGKDVEGTPGNFDVVAKEIKDLNRRTQLKGPVLQNAAQSSST